METAIVTVMTADGSFSGDMELPTNLSVKDLIPRIADLIGMIEPMKIANIREPALFVGGKMLKAEQTLDEQSVFDGTIITIGGTV